MRLFKLVFFALSIAFIYSSCGTEASDPQITINSPNNGDTFKIGDTVEVNATATDDTGIIAITGSVPALSFSQTERDFDDPTNISYNQTLTIIPGFVPAGEYDVVLTAEDGDGNIAESTITLTLQD